MEVIGLFAATILLAAVVRGYFAWLGGVLMARLVHHDLVSSLQRAVFRKLQRMSFRFFDLQSRGSIINRATGDIQAIRNFVDTCLIQALLTLLSALVYAGYMITISPALTLACLGTLPLMCWGSVIFSRLVHPEYMKNRELFDRMIRTLAENIEGASVVKGFAREPESIAHFRSENLSVKDQQRKIFSYVSIFTPCIDFLSQANLVILLLYGGILVIHGQIPLGMGLVVFAGLLQQFSNQIGQLAMIANTVQESLASAGRVFTLLDSAQGLDSPAQPVPFKEGKGAVAFERVSFGYTDGRTVLHEINFSVEPGECIAIVGETGSGKTALLNLIPRFYDPGQGRVLIDGQDLQHLDLQALRRKVGFVFQESFLFSDTVAVNIAFGDADAGIDRIIHAAKIARAHDFIQALPNGYDTILGESGVDLSGGQRQRLAIARALLSDPKILVLDDPTAAIDPETEHEILDAIEAALKGRTTFIVAHRLSTLKRANRILVLERGRVVQTGNHFELIQTEGPYREAALHQLIDEESRRQLARDLRSIRALEEVK
jgi:ATP-binding cassette subfamily B protein